MGKQNRFGKASIISEETYLKLQGKTKNPKWKLFFAIAWHTGERVGAIRQLRVSDVYHPDGTVKDAITYRALTRKKDTKGNARTRQVWINDTLRQALVNYPMPGGEALFPGKLHDKPMSASNVDKMFRYYFSRAGLDMGGYSCHSFRRTFITRLSEAGINIKVMQELTGHRDVRSLLGYVEVSPKTCQAALAAIA